jgi:uncharacterized damage-inducible protein DinB
MRKPLKEEYPEGIYFSRYIESVDNENVMEVLKANAQLLDFFYKNLKIELQNHKYQADKWSLKEILGHLTDTERIFGFRALAIARGEKQSLPGFDENQYMDTANFDAQTLTQLLIQYNTTRIATLALFESFSEQVQDSMGTANGNSISVRALMFMIAGHEIHHIKIMNQRYGTNIA